MALVGCYVALCKPLVAAVPIFLLGWMRFGIAGVAMASWWRKPADEVPINRETKKLLFLESFVGNFLFSLCMLFGVSMTSAVSAGLILAAIPAASALMGHYVLGDRLGPRVLAAVACAGAGIALLAFSKSTMTGELAIARTAAENREWLTPWEATLPKVPEHIDGGELLSNRPSFLEMVRIHNREGRSGRSISLAIWQGPNLIGQITLGGIIYGALRGAHIGYWIDRRFANRGFTTQAVEVLTAYGFNQLGLHRIEINLRPENAASRRVAEKAGFIFEGDRPRFLHIDGAWRDHICFVKENPVIK